MGELHRVSRYSSSRSQHSATIQWIEAATCHSLSKRPQSIHRQQKGIHTGGLKQKQRGLTKHSSGRRGSNRLLMNYRTRVEECRLFGGAAEFSVILPDRRWSDIDSLLSGKKTAKAQALSENIGKGCIMELPDNIIKHYLRNIYFISGGLCGGKSTIAKYLSQKYDL